MKKIFAQILLPLFAFGSAASTALADTITFDNPPCTALNPAGGYPGNCYYSNGLILGSSGGPGGGLQMFAIGADATASSALNVARPIGGFSTLNGSFLIVPPYQGFGANAVSLNVTGSVSGQKPWQLIFYGMESELERFSGVSDQRITVSHAAIALHGLVFGFNFTIGNPLQGIDSLSIGPGSSVIDLSATPEPATLLLVATGAVALVRRRVRFGRWSS